MKYLFGRTKNNVDFIAAWTMGGAFISEDYVVLAIVFVVGAIVSGAGEAIT